MSGWDVANGWRPNLNVSRATTETCGLASKTDQRFSTRLKHGGRRHSFKKIIQVKRVDKTGKQNRCQEYLVESDGAFV